MNIWLIIPTNRTINFLKEWGGQFKSATIAVIEDRSEKTLTLPAVPCRRMLHFVHADIEREMAEVAWIFPRQSAAIRSFGFYKAYRAGADIIATLDDDCYPLELDFIKKHVANLSLKLPRRWYPTYPFRDTLFTRGFPYVGRKKIPVVVSHGIWSGMPDFDAIAQLLHPHRRIHTLPPILTPIPQGYFFPMSSMNLAFRREATPLMYQLLMGRDRHGKPWGFSRFDDIWSGVFAKKILDHLELGVVSGSPAVNHKRASDPWLNLKKEAAGMILNEVVWQRAADVALTTTTPLTCYRELAQKINFPKLPYFTKLRRAMLAWAGLF